MISIFQKIKDLIDKNSNFIAYLLGHWHEKLSYIKNRKEHLVVPAFTDKGYGIWSPCENHPSEESF